jgi:outer membrane lipoprotein-sorting protein
VKRQRKRRKGLPFCHQQKFVFIALPVFFADYLFSAYVKSGFLMAHHEAGSGFMIYSVHLSLQIFKEGSCQESRKARPYILEHFPLKWIPVEWKTMQQKKNLERRSDTIRLENALTDARSFCLNEGKVADPGKQDILRISYLVPFFFTVCFFTVCLLALSSARAQDFPQVLGILPPVRPVTAGGGVSLSPNQTETVTAVAPKTPLDLVSRAPSAMPLSEAAIVEKANVWFNGLTSLTAHFVQAGADGRRLQGRLSLQRPGKLRFDYSDSPIEVIADGQSVAVRDRKLATQDLYPISQTPLKFLVRERIDLRRDLILLDVTSDPGGVRLIVEDRSTLGGTSRIVLFFDPSVEALQQWRITDPQGGQTSIVLSQLDKGKRLDPKLFVINYEQQILERRE